MMPTFFLAGLESRGFEKLYRALVENGIDCVVDIRLSRDVDLEGMLRSHNEARGRHIDYLWLKFFGNPFFDRDDPVESYRGYLVGMDKELEELYDRLIRRRCCIVDGGKDPGRSCRMALAEALRKRYGIVYADLSMAKELVEKYGAIDEHT